MGYTYLCNCFTFLHYHFYIKAVIPGLYILVVNVCLFHIKLIILNIMTNICQRWLCKVDNEFIVLKASMCMETKAKKYSR